MLIPPIILVKALGIKRASNFKLNEFPKTQKQRCQNTYGSFNKIYVRNFLLIKTKKLTIYHDQVHEIIQCWCALFRNDQVLESATYV